MNRKLLTPISLLTLGGFLMTGSVSAYASAATAAAAPVAPARQVLTCADSRARIGQFLDLHISFREFDNALSKRTFHKLFESFDSGKYYFFATDIEKFKSLEEKIDDNVAKADCKFLTDIHAVFLQRVKEHHELAMKLLSQPARFDIEDEMIVDSKRINWAATKAEMEERWRSRIKFQVLNMKGIEGEEKARERLRKRYEQIKKSYEDQTSDEIFSVLVNSFASSLDPHSSYMLPADQEDFNIRLGNSLEGIGATLRDVNGYTTVESLIPGGAASRDARLKVGDKIVAVDPGDGTGVTDTIDMPLNKVVRLIRGKKGTTVKLLILRKADTPDGEPQRMTINIVRDAVKLTASAAKSEVFTVSGKKIGVLRLPTFYTDFTCRRGVGRECQGAAFDTQREIKKLQAQKVDGIVLDLRSNGGGDLQESVRLTGLFIPEGTVVQTVDRRRVVKLLQDQDPAVDYAGPLAVLINRQSASASEIVAGALQDYGRALVVGNTHTFGKGTVQVVQEVPGSRGRRSDGAIKVTQSKFYRPSGPSNQSKGIESDIVIPSILEVYDIAEKENQYAIPWDAIKPAADFKPVQNLKEFIPVLTEKSAQRVKQSSDFKELTTRIEKVKLEREKGTVSLKEEKPSTETKEAKEAKKEEKAEEVVDESTVIKKDDFELKEAANILVDAIELLKKPSWVATARK